MSRLFTVFYLIVLNCLSCWCVSNDEYQQHINEEAFRNRFNREPIAEEATGIKIQRQLGKNNRHWSLSRNFKWKVIDMSGDDSISAFDNARIKIHKMFSEYGTSKSIQLSRDSRYLVNGVRESSVPNFQKASQELLPNSDEGCLIFMTSHGSPNGFYIRGLEPLIPAKMNQVIKESCGDHPTVMLVSACYSGIFAEPALQADNRIILTAARKDKTSFGCSAEANYTYWDGCLIDELDRSVTWLELAEKVEKCIERKESAGGFSRSYPQARFGANVQFLPIRN